MTTTSASEPPLDPGRDAGSPNLIGRADAPARRPDLLTPDVAGRVMRVAGVVGAAERGCRVDIGARARPRGSKWWEQPLLLEDGEPLAEHVLGVDAVGEAGLADLHRAEQRGRARGGPSAPNKMSA